MSHYTFDIYCKECEDYICSYYLDYEGDIDRICKKCKTEKETPLEYFIRNLKGE